jgi:hypothetical protein
MLLMPPTSGIFTGLSTAILPDDPVRHGGHSTGMELKPILKRIEGRLKLQGLSADAASKAAGKPDAIRNLRRAVKEGGRKGVSTDTLRALAPVLGVTAGWILGEKPDDVRSEDVAASLDRPPAPAVKIKGYVGAGAEAHFYAVADDAFEEAPALPGSSDQTIALQIRGKSWGPAMDSWLVFYDDVRSPVTADMIGEACVVGLADDRILLKVIRSNGRGGFDLHPNSTTEDVVRNAQIEWAAKVIVMRPR